MGETGAEKHSIAAYRAPLVFYNSTANSIRLNDRKASLQID